MTHIFSSNHIAFISGMPGSGEIIVIFIVILVLFGPKKLPEIARMIGHTLDHLRKASQEFKDEIMKIEDNVKEEIKSATSAVIDVSSTSDSSDELVDVNPEDVFNDNSDEEGTVGIASEENEKGERKEEPAG